MEAIRIPRPVNVASEERRTAALIAQYIHELSSRHADVRASAGA